MPVGEKRAEEILGPPPELDTLKRDILRILREVGHLQTGKTVDASWAFWAAVRLAQAKLDVIDFEIDNCQDYALTARVLACANILLVESRQRAEAKAEAKSKAPFEPNR